MVQTFLVEETKELIYDADKQEEWKKKCEELGLTEQLNLAAPDKSPIPFEHMNTVSIRVYETLCPEKVEFKKYRKTSIPLEVLGLIHLSVNEGYFDEIQIWYDDKTPDPLAVGVKKDGEWGNREFYLMARWGDALKPFEKLKETAIKRYTHSAKIALQKRISEYNAKLSEVTLNTERYFDAQADSYEVRGYA